MTDEAKKAGEFLAAQFDKAVEDGRRTSEATDVDRYHGMHTQECWEYAAQTARDSGRSYCIVQCADARTARLERVTNSATKVEFQRGDRVRTTKDVLVEIRDRGGVVVDVLDGNVQVALDEDAPSMFQDRRWFAPQHLRKTPVNALRSTSARCPECGGTEGHRMSCTGRGRPPAIPPTDPEAERLVSARMAGINRGLVSRPTSATARTCGAPGCLADALPDRGHCSDACFKASLRASDASPAVGDLVRIARDGLWPGLPAGTFALVTAFPSNQVVRLDIGGWGDSFSTATQNVEVVRRARSTDYAQHACQEAISQAADAQWEAALENAERVCLERAAQYTERGDVLYAENVAKACAAAIASLRSGSTPKRSVDTKEKS